VIFIFGADRGPIRCRDGRQGLSTSLMRRRVEIREDEEMEARWSWIRSGAAGAVCLLALMYGYTEAALAEDHTGASAASAASGAAGADGETEANDENEKKTDEGAEKSDAERISELEKAVGVLASELSNALADEAVPPDVRRALKEAA